MNGTWLCLGALLLSLFSAFRGSQARALPATSFAGEGDQFTLYDTSYAEGQGFVYSSTITFTSGQAAGVVFGGAEGQHYYVLNVDRFEDHVKLLYFSSGDQGVSYTPQELNVDYFIGNDKMSEGELALTKPRVANLASFQLKVILSYSEAKAYVECYVDNIKRFGVDNGIILSNYSGGFLGLNVFNANVSHHDIEIGASDYAYYTEEYRNQYHFTPFAHWNNDPNGLVYYQGYYHLYYQSNPFDVYWGSMYWAHARSKDLVHWELLPLCLFPDTAAAGFGEGDGYMWSGTAMVYHAGTSSLIDSYHWYPQGNGSGLLAVYTRDGGLQNQVFMSSDDGGYTWSKRFKIDQTVVGYSEKIACRDPKLFPVIKNAEGTVTTWGLALTGKDLDKVWFLKSNDFVNWSLAGGFVVSKPECIDVVDVRADDGTNVTLLTIAGREYVCGQMVLTAEGLIDFRLEDGGYLSSNSLSLSHFKTLDYGPDSYATQTFANDDATSPTFGQAISLSWFSGVPDSAESVDSGAFAEARKTWNGSGFTMPVRYGLSQVDSSYRLTETPLTDLNAGFGKTSLLSLSNQSLDSSSANPLSAIAEKQVEISASIDNPTGKAIAFRVDVGADEYTEIGWNSTDGYYVDRSHTDDGGITLTRYGYDNYHQKYASHVLGSSTLKTFVILADAGGIEVFAESYRLPFYLLTLSSPYALGVSLAVEGPVTIASLKAERIPSIWRNDSGVDEGVLYLDQTSVHLDLELRKSAEIPAYYSGQGSIEWSLQSGADIVALSAGKKGEIVTAKKAGTALLKASAGGTSKEVQVLVHSPSSFTDSFPLSSTASSTGSWYLGDAGLVGSAPHGDGFILGEQSAASFAFSARFALAGTAAALLFHADESLSSFVAATFDSTTSRVKLWSPHGEIASAAVSVPGPGEITLLVVAEDETISVALNGTKALEAKLTANEPLSGHFGLNVFKGTATFVEATVKEAPSAYAYSGGDLSVSLPFEGYVSRLFNVTSANAVVDPSFYALNGSALTLSSLYFQTLPTLGTYRFLAESDSASFSFDVSVNAYPELRLPDLTIQAGLDVSLFVGHCVLTSVQVNGTEAPADRYQLANYVLTLSAQLFHFGSNVVKLNGLYSCTITVHELGQSSSASSIEASSAEISSSSLSASLAPSTENPGLWIALAGGGGVLLFVSVVLIVLQVKKRKKP